MIWTTTACAQEPREMRGLDFLVDFRELVGKQVYIPDCLIGGTTSEWIRCEAPGNAGSYAVNADTMNREDLRWAYATCPTGSRFKPACRVGVVGTVVRSAIPKISDARLVR